VTRSDGLRDEAKLPGPEEAAYRPATRCRLVRPGKVTDPGLVEPRVRDVWGTGSPHVEAAEPVVGFIGGCPGSGSSGVVFVPSLVVGSGGPGCGLVERF
jgi:hypothetical protein